MKAMGLIGLLAAACASGWVHVHPTVADDDGVRWTPISCEDVDTCMQEMARVCKSRGGFFHSDFQELSQEDTRCLTESNRFFSATHCRTGDEVVGVKVAFRCKPEDEP